MQFSGIGQEHNREMHHVTTCVHDHSHYHLEGETGAASAAKQQSAQPAQSQPEGEFSLSAWLEKTLGKGKNLLQGFWGSGEVPGTGEPGDMALAAQVLVRPGEEADREAANGAGTNSFPQEGAPVLHAPQAAAATAAQISDMRGNPCFSIVQDTENGKESILQKMREKFKDITGQLAGHLPGKFSGAGQRGNFQAGKDRPKEDLRRHSTYRRDQVEIDCILTDDSYLLDSYDRKGGYSKLTTKK